MMMNAFRRVAVRSQRLPFQRMAPVMSRGFADSHFLEREVVEPRVLEVVKNFDKVDEAKVTATTKFTDLGLDSLDAVEVVMAFEDEFMIEISDVEAEKIQSTNEAIDYITTHPAAK